MQPICSYLAVANVTASMDFLEKAFGFSRGVVLADAERTDALRRNASRQRRRHSGSQRRRGDGDGWAAALYTYVEDVDGALARARKAGAGVDEAEDKPWGDRVAVVTDPDGYRWVLATFKKLAPFT